MLTYLYQVILATMSFLIIYRIFNEKKIWEQFMATMVLVPLIMRLLMLK